MPESFVILLVALIYFATGAAMGWFTAARPAIFLVGSLLIPLLVTGGFALVSVPYILPGLLMIGMLPSFVGAFVGRHLRTTTTKRE